MDSLLQPNQQHFTRLSQSDVSPTSSTIINVDFGLCAVVVGTVTIWQGQMALRRWYSRRTALEESDNQGSLDLRNQYQPSCTTISTDNPLLLVHSHAQQEAGSRMQDIELQTRNHDGNTAPMHHQ